MLFWEVHEGENVDLGFIEQGGEFRQTAAQLIGDVAPLLAGGGRCVLGDSGRDKGGDDASPVLAGMGESVAHEVHAAALPARAEHLAGGSLEPFMGVRDDQLDPAQTAPCQLAQEVSPERLGLDICPSEAETFWTNIEAQDLA